MRTNQARQTLLNGGVTVGSWLNIPSPFSAMTMAKMGFDWLTVDSEHSPIDVSTQSLMCYAIAKEGCVPLVRVPFNCESDIKRALDGGAYGIVVPMVKSRKEAEEVVSYVKYPPVGIRSRGGSMHTLTFDCDGNTY